MNLQELEKASPGHYFYDLRDQLKWHVYRRSETAFAAGDAARDALTTREALEARQRALREHFLGLIGGLPPMDTPLEAQTVGVVEGDGFRIEKVVFQSRPRTYVTCSLYLPDGLDGPRGAVLFLCGHAEQGKQYREYQAVCQYLVKAGLVVLAQDPIGQGERYSYYDRDLKAPIIGPCCPEHDYAGAQCLPVGDSPARYFLHDSMRAIDYLRSRHEVDPDRIGITGNSGGGTQSCLMMLGDPRIAAAAPGTFLMNRETYMRAGGAQDAEQIWPTFTAAGYDHEDVLLAMVPRPALVLAVTDDFFPIEGTRRTVARARRFWDLYGCPESLESAEDQSTHAYTRKLAAVAAGFFAKHLLGKEVDMTTATVTPFPPETLWCTASGQVRAEHEDAAAIFEANLERMQRFERQRLAIPAAERRTRALEWLRAKVLKDRRPCDLNPRFYNQGHPQDRWENISVSMGLWWSQEGLFNHGYLFRDVRAPDAALPVTLALWDGGTNCLQPHSAWIRSRCEAGRAVLVLDVVGSGVLTPHPLHEGFAPDQFYGVLHKFTDDLMWLDDDMAALRTYDVLRALDMIARWPGLDAGDIRLHASGLQGIYGRLAAPLDPRIRQVEVADGPASYAQWIGARYYDTRNIKTILLRHMLQYFDLPELESPVPGA
jgi:hypothetical protein